MVIFNPSGLYTSVHSASYFLICSQFCEMTTSKLTWIPLAQLLGGRAHLAVHDALVLLLLCVGLQALPRKAAPDEVHKHVPGTKRPRGGSKIKLTTK